MAVAVSQVPWQGEEAAIETAVHHREELTFIRRVRGDASRVIRLLEGGLLSEAHSTLGGLVHETHRRETQVAASDGSDSAA